MQLCFSNIEFNFLLIKHKGMRLAQIHTSNNERDEQAFDLLHSLPEYLYNTSWSYCTQLGVSTIFSASANEQEV